MNQNSSAKNGKMNQFMYGSGIVAGYYIVSVDEQTISVEPGMALDDMGNELSMAKAYVKKLAFMDGFKTAVDTMKNKTIYVCLEQKEENNYLYLTSKEPGEALQNVEDWYMQKDVVYSQHGVTIRHILPKYIKTGEKAELRVEVEIDAAQKQPFSFDYDIDMTYLKCKSQPKLHVHFDMEGKSAPGCYWCTYEIVASDAEARGSVTVDEESFLFELEDIAQVEKATGKSIVNIENKEITDLVKKDYYSKSVKELFHDESRCPLYLARIILDVKGDMYKIVSIDNAPFQQYAVNPVLTRVLEQVAGKTADISDKQKAVSMEKTAVAEKKVFPAVRITQGSCIIPLAAKTAKGQRYFSAEIMHGLGAGKVMLTLSLQKDKENLVYGDASIFEPNEPVTDVAADLNPEKGSFIVGIRLRKKTKQEQIVVHWTAIKDNSEQIYTAEQKRIQIEPSVINLKVRERYQLHAISENMLEQEIEWIVKDKQGGEIDENAVYTSPNTPGVYEIVAQSSYMPEVRSVAYVVVRDRD